MQGVARASSDSSSASVAPAEQPSASTSTTEALQAFWLAQGLAEYQAEHLVPELLRRGGQYTDPAWLSERLAQLASALPGPVPPLVYTDSDLLDPQQTDAQRLAQQLVELKEALPGVDVWEVVTKQPRLLRTNGVGSKVRGVVAKLVKLFPYKSNDKEAEVLQMVQEYPTLLVRMEFYLGDKYRTVEDLPVDIQNDFLRNYCA